MESKDFMSGHGGNGHSILGFWKFSGNMSNNLFLEESTYDLMGALENRDQWTLKGLRRNFFTMSNLILVYVKLSMREI
jgi:hypothetical protein